MTATVTRIYLFTLCLSLAGLFTILGLGLLPALLGGLLVYYMTEFGSHSLRRVGIVRNKARVILLAFITIIVLALLVFAGFALLSFMSNGQESLEGLMRRMADVVKAANNYLPLWVKSMLPTNVEEWQTTLSDWLRHNAMYLSSWGKGLGMLLVHTLFGMIIGGLVAVSPPGEGGGILAQELKQRAMLLGKAFRQIVFSQFKISALNTFLTAIFLGIILPLTGNHLPFVKTMIMVTFFVGLLPIVGNLISNSIIFLIALSVSPFTAIASLCFLIVIHKLEYFVNAHIIGTHIKARAWEILLAMLVLESAFGLKGLVAAPIFYAYLKDELTEKKLI